MTDKEKLEKIKSLSDKMYTSMQNLTTDTAPIRKAMNEYHQFIIQHWHEKEPVSEELEEAAKHYLYSNILYDDVYVGNPTDKDCIEMFKAGANWQKQQMIDKACEWLRKELAGYVYAEYVAEELTGEACISDNMIVDFRKSMEEENNSKIY